jgi:hypothetical protein
MMVLAVDLPLNFLRGKSVMSKLIYNILILTIAMGIVFAGDAMTAQNTSTVIKALDASGVEGITGVILLVNPGDAHKSQALITDAHGEAITHDLHCDICTISAFDPRGLFASRTTEFASSRSSFSLVMESLPIIDTVGDPNAVLIELVINDSNGRPLAQHDVVIRPTLMTLQNNQISVQRTDAKGGVKIHLRIGEYTAAALNGETPTESRFEITTTKGQCSARTPTCIVAPPRSSHRLKPVALQLLNSNLKTLK